MGKYHLSAQNETNEGACMVLLVSDGNVLPEITEIRAASVEETPDDEKFEFAIYEVSTEGSGGTAVNITKRGPAANPSCNAIAGTFSGAPTKVDTNRRGTIVVHRRATDVIKNAPPDGLKPSAIADGRGLAIFCVQAPSVGTFNFGIDYEE